jgi:hypothetical protein
LTTMSRIESKTNSTDELKHVLVVFHDGSVGCFQGRRDSLEECSECMKCTAF